MATFIVTTFMIYFCLGEVKEVLLEYVGLLMVLAVVSLFVSVHCMNNYDWHLDNQTWGSE